jgi:putative transposase
VHEGKQTFHRRRTPVMDSQHSTPSEETPTSDSVESESVERTVPESLQHLMDQPPDVKLQLLRHHAEMARLLAEDILEGEVEDLAGERYDRKSAGNSLRRWGTNPGSIRIDGERVPIEVPRVRDVEAGEERSLRSYQAMKESNVGKELTDAILLGLSQGDYERVASQFIDGFGLSQSSVSRRFQERAQKALEEFEERPLEEKNFLARGHLDGQD